MSVSVTRIPSCYERSLAPSPSDYDSEVQLWLDLILTGRDPVKNPGVWMTHSKEVRLQFFPLANHLHPKPFYFAKCISSKPNIINSLSSDPSFPAYSKCFCPVRFFLVLKISSLLKVFSFYTANFTTDVKTLQKSELHEFCLNFLCKI